MEHTKIDPPESHHVNTHVNMAQRHGLVQHFQVSVNTGLTLGNHPSHTLVMRKARGSDIGRAPAQMVRHDTNMARAMMNQ
mgnify:CR=1